MVHDKYGDVTLPFIGMVVENKAFVNKKNISSQGMADIKTKTGT